MSDKSGWFPVAFVLATIFALIVARMDVLPYLCHGASGEPKWCMGSNK